MQSYNYFNRDISWLSFNERVLLEAASDRVPLFEKINFLSIYSSNLDEFYRVRIPSLIALKKLSKADVAVVSGTENVLDKITEQVNLQQQFFGTLIRQVILPQLITNNIKLIYDEPIPGNINSEINDYFFTQVLSFIQPISVLNTKFDFFSENNKLYKLAVIESPQKKEELFIINIPDEHLPRFFSFQKEGIQYIVFLEDIIKANLDFIFKDKLVIESYNFKITRDGALDLNDEYEEDLAEKIEKKIGKRDLGSATRFLYDSALPTHILKLLIHALKLRQAGIVAGGPYHNLKDFASLPKNIPSLSYSKREPIKFRLPPKQNSLLDQIAAKDIMIHTPYHSYDTILRFFNEAAADISVEEIYVTLYRIAGDSKIAHALISAAKNGKKVFVLVELKARFDEANNVQWSKKMKAAGVKIFYSSPALKVHAKCAFVKRRMEGRMKYVGLLATGNLNENTAKFYTDHILLTAKKELLRELELLFIFLAKKTKTGDFFNIPFRKLLVAKFNLQQKFIALIDREKKNALNGKAAVITIKLNNLEEKILINKLYEASNAGVKIYLIVRSICCLVPGIKGMSEHITVRRIVDRYLEHGRIFVFHNSGNPLVYMGSADWMNRNIYRRIEVCFPVNDKLLKDQVLDLINIQLKDNMQAVLIDDTLANIPVKNNSELISAQETIYQKLSHKK